MFSDQNPIWFLIMELFFIILVLGLNFFFIILKALVLFIQNLEVECLDFELY